jgi:hypothetical protein
VSRSTPYRQKFLLWHIQDYVTQADKEK